MDLSLIVLIQCLIMFIYIMIGYLLYKTKLISDSGAKTLGNILVYVVIPMVIIKSFLTERTNELTISLLWSFALGTLALVIAIIVGLIIYRNHDGALNFSVAFSNAGFMGIPLVSAVLGDEAVIYISGMVAVMNILQYTYGQFIISHNKKTIKIKNILTSPVLLALVIGIILYAININWPTIITTPIMGLQALNTPLAMLVIGVYLAKTPLKNIFISWKIYLVSLLRLIVVPMITIFIFSLFKINETILLAVIIAASAPVGSNVVLFSQKNDIDSSDGVEAVCQSTILSIISLPLMIMLANYMLSLV